MKVFTPVLFNTLHKFIYLFIYFQLIKYQVVVFKYSTCSLTKPVKISVLHSILAKYRGVFVMFFVLTSFIEYFFPFNNIVRGSCRDQFYWLTKSFDTVVG